MPIQVVRFKSRATLPAPLAAHLRADPDARPVEAVPRDDRPPRDLGSDPDRAAKLVRDSLAVRRRGRRGQQCVDVLIAGPPPFESLDAWPDERVDRWAADSAAWIKDLAGVPLHTAALHTDERSPHVHAAFPPFILDEKGRPRLSWKAAQATMAERAAGREVQDHRAQLAAIQDHYHQHVGARYELDRGERGSRRRHQAPDRAQGLRDRVRDAERQAREAEQARVEADERAAAAEKERREAEDVAHDAQRRSSAAHARAESDRRALTAARRRARDTPGEARTPAPRTVARRPAPTRGSGR